MKTVLFALLSVVTLSGCEEYVVTERHHSRHYVTYVPDRPYYNVYYEDEPRPYYMRRYYSNEPRFRVYESRRYYQRPSSRVIVNF